MAVVSIHVKQVVSVWEKTAGLIGKRNIYPTLFKTRFGIHTFGMNVPIDAIVLNRDYFVVAVKRNIKPNRIFFWNPLYNTVIELPQSTISKKKIKIGDTIECVG